MEAAPLHLAHALQHFNLLPRRYPKLLDQLIKFTLAVRQDDGEAAKLQGAGLPHKAAHIKHGGVERTKLIMMSRTNEPAKILQPIQVSFWPSG